MCLCVHRPVLRRHVPLAVPVGSKLSVRPHAVSVLGAALQAAARRAGHSGQAGGSVERRRGERISRNTHARKHERTHVPRGEAAFPSPPLLVLQVFRFVQNLIGCEEQARIFKDEVTKIIILVKLRILIGEIYFKTFVLCWIVDMRMLLSKDQDSFSYLLLFLYKKSTEILSMIIKRIS